MAELPLVAVIHCLLDPYIGAWSLLAGFEDLATMLSLDCSMTAHRLCKLFSFVKLCLRQCCSRVDVGGASGRALS